MERLNTVLFVVYDDESLPIYYNLRLTGTDTSYVISCPGLTFMKSGLYRVTGSTGLTYVDDKVEVISSDYTFNFVPAQVVSPDDGHQVSGLGLIDRALENATEKIFKIDLEELEPLSSVYYRFLLNDYDINSFLFANGYSMSLDREEMEGIGLIRMGTKLEDEQKEGRNVQMLLCYKNREWVPGPYESIDVSDGPGAILLEEEDGDRLEEVIIVFSNSSIDQEASPIMLPPEIEISNYANYKWEGEVNMAASSNGITETVSINNIKWQRTDIEGYGEYTSGEELNEKSTKFGETRFPLFLALGYDLVSAQKNWKLSGQREIRSLICTYTGSDGYNVDGTAMEALNLNNLITLHHIYEEAESYRSFFHFDYQPWPFKTVSYTMVCFDQSTG